MNRAAPIRETGSNCPSLGQPFLLPNIHAKLLRKISEGAWQMRGLGGASSQGYANSGKRYKDASKIGNQVSSSHQALGSRYPPRKPHHFHVSIRLLQNTMISKPGVANCRPVSSHTLIFFSSSFYFHHSHSPTHPINLNLRSKYPYSNP
jgi:hypothetical protein